MGSSRASPVCWMVLSKGAGHAVVHDMRWSDRETRVADLLWNMAASPLSSSNRPSSTTREPHPNFGPHLIATSSGEDFEKFAAAFDQLGCGLHRNILRKDDGNDPSTSTSDDSVSLCVLPYHGTKDERRRLRKHFGSLAPSPESQLALSCHTDDLFRANGRLSPFLPDTVPGRGVGRRNELPGMLTF